METKTQSGFLLSLDPDRLDDWELIEDLTELMEENNSLKVVPVMKKLLGDEQYKKLKDHLREKDGKVKLTAMAEEFKSIMTTDELKKSMPSV